MPYSSRGLSGRIRSKTPVTLKVDVQLEPAARVGRIDVGAHDRVLADDRVGRADADERHRHCCCRDAACRRTSREARRRPRRSSSRRCRWVERRRARAADCRPRSRREAPPWCRRLRPWSREAVHAEVVVRRCRSACRRRTVQNCCALWSGSTAVNCAGRRRGGPSSVTEPVVAPPVITGASLVPVIAIVRVVVERCAPWLSAIV